MELLVSEDVYKTNGVHIGTRQKSGDVKRFIYRARTDGLYVIDIIKTDERIRYASKMISRYNPEKILVVASREYAKKPVSIFAREIGAKVIAGRFIPGTLTNPMLKTYIEPELVIITDPAIDTQALKESAKIGVPVIALCDVNNDVKYIDFVIPTNNKGRKALALIYYLLCREVMKMQGKIKDDNEFKLKPEDFEAPL